MANLENQTRAGGLLFGGASPLGPDSGMCSIATRLLQEAIDSILIVLLTNSYECCPGG